MKKFILLLSFFRACLRRCFSIHKSQTPRASNILFRQVLIVYSLQKKFASFQYKNICAVAKITQFGMRCILTICLFIFTQCELTQDADCKKQKDDEQKCLRAFTLFCSGNRTMAECDGGVNSIIFICTVCKLDAPCKSNTDDVVSDKIQTGNTK